MKINVNIIEYIKKNKKRIVALTTTLGVTLGSVGLIATNQQANFIITGNVDKLYDINKLENENVELSPNNESGTLNWVNDNEALPWDLLEFDKVANREIDFNVAYNGNYYIKYSDLNVKLTSDINHNIKIYKKIIDDNSNISNKYKEMLKQQIEDCLINDSLYQDDNFINDIGLLISLYNIKSYEYVDKTDKKNVAGYVNTSEKNNVIVPTEDGQFEKVSYGFEKNVVIYDDKALVHENNHLINGNGYDTFGNDYDLINEAVNQIKTEEYKKVESFKSYKNSVVATKMVMETIGIEPVLYTYAYKDTKDISSIEREFLKIIPDQRKYNKLEEVLRVPFESIDDKSKRNKKINDFINLISDYYEAKTGNKITDNLLMTIYTKYLSYTTNMKQIGGIDMDKININYIYENVHKSYLYSEEKSFKPYISYDVYKLLNDNVTFYNYDSVYKYLKNKYSNKYSSEEEFMRLIKNDLDYLDEKRKIISIEQSQETYDSQNNLTK